MPLVKTEKKKCLGKRIKSAQKVERLSASDVIKCKGKSFNKGVVNNVKLLKVSYRCILWWLATLYAIGEGNKPTELLQFHQILFSDSDISGRKRNWASRVEALRKAGSAGNVHLPPWARDKGLCYIVKARASEHCKNAGLIHPSTIWHFCYFLPRDACFSL